MQPFHHFNVAHAAALLLEIPFKNAFTSCWRVRDLPSIDTTWTVRLGIGVTLQP